MIEPTAELPKDNAQLLQAHMHEGVILDPKGLEGVFENAGQNVDRIVSEAGFDPNQMLYAGYDASKDKPVDGEHAVGEGQHDYYLGTRKSMDLHMEGDEEERGERLVTNPGKYALEGGTLGVYDPKELQAEGIVVEVDTEYGTWLVTASPGQMATHRKLEIPKDQLLEASEATNPKVDAVSEWMDKFDKELMDTEVELPDGTKARLHDAVNANPDAQNGLNERTAMVQLVDDAGNGRWMKVSELLETTSGGNVVETESRPEIRSELSNAAEEIGEVAVNEETVVLFEAEETDSDPENTDAADETTNESEKLESEVVQPALSEVFTSVESFEEAMNNPNLDPDVKTSLRGVQRAWTEIALRTTGNELWQQAISPKLRGLSEVLPQVDKMAMGTQEQVEQLARGLKILGNAIESRNPEEISHALARHRITDTVGQVVGMAQAIDKDARLQESGRALDVEAMQSDERLQQLKSGSLGDKQKELLVAEVRALVAGGQELPAIVESLQQRLAEDKSVPWQKRRDDIDTVTRFARRAANPELVKILRPFMNQFEPAIDSLRRGRSDAAEFYQLAQGRALQEVVAALEDMHVMTRLARATTDQAR